MQHTRIPILCTAPLSKHLVRTAAENGLDIDIIPFIKIEAIESAEVARLIRLYAAKTIRAVFTSLNAAETVIKELNGVKPLWRLYCIGNTTRDTLVRYFGSNSVHSVGNTASDLANNMIGTSDRDKVIFFCGDHRREELPGILNDNQIELEEIIVYRTIQVTNNISKDYHAIMFFSPSAVSSFFATNQVDRRTILFAIGETTSESIKTYSENLIVVADEPGKEKLVHTMISYYQSLNRESLANQKLK